MVVFSWAVLLRPHDGREVNFRFRLADPAAQVAWVLRLRQRLPSLLSWAQSLGARDGGSAIALADGLHDRSWRDGIHDSYNKNKPD